MQLRHTVVSYKILGKYSKKKYLKCALSYFFFKVSVRSYSILKRNRAITCERGLTRKQHRTPIMTPYLKAGEVIYIYSYKSWLRCWMCMAPAFLLFSGGFWLLQSRASEVPDSGVFSVYSKKSSYVGTSVRFSCLLASYGCRIVHVRFLWETGHNLQTSKSP